MNQLRDLFRRMQTPIEPIPAGTYHYQAPPGVSPHYRLHLRVQPGGLGLLIVNASTVLHLNETAAEYAYHLIQGTPPEQASKAVADRYQVKRELALADFNDFKDRIQSLILMPDLDPVTYLHFDRQTPFAEQFAAPLRLDIALTYRTITPEDLRVAPSERVVRELSTDEWQAVLEKAWNAGIPHVIFTGGEPTLRDDLPQLIQHAEDLGQVTGVLSDGLRLVDDTYRDQLLQSGLDHLMLVLHPEMEGSWESLNRVLAEDLFTTVHLTLTPANVDQVEQVLDRLAKMGVTAVSLSAAQVNLMDELQKARDEVAKRELTLVWDLPVPYSALNPVDMEIEEAPQGAGNAWLYLEPDGDVLPAQGINRILGNLSEETWEDVQERINQQRSGE